MMVAAAASALVVATAVRFSRRLPVPRRPGCGDRRRRARLRQPTTEQLCDLLHTAAAEVRTGSSLPAALRHAFGTHGPFAGLGIEAALPMLPAQPVTADVAVVVHAINAAHALGGQVAATLDGAAALLRERSALRSESLAHAAQARLSARVLTAVPVAFAGWSAASSASFRAALLQPPGTICACAGCALNALGWWWMRAVVGRAAA